MLARIVHALCLAVLSFNRGGLGHLMCEVLIGVRLPDM